MFIEIHVASNFIASLLYNRLPRRRVNIFGEELEKALKDKFVGHWYPEMPEKGSILQPELSLKEYTFSKSPEKEFSVENFIEIALSIAYNFDDLNEK